MVNYQPMKSPRRSQVVRLDLLPDLHLCSREICPLFRLCPNRIGRELQNEWHSKKRLYLHADAFCVPRSPCPPSRRGAGRMQSGRDGAVLRQRGRDELPIVLATVVGRRVGDERLRRRVVRPHGPPERLGPLRDRPVVDAEARLRRKVPGSRAGVHRPGIALPSAKGGTSVVSIHPRQTVYIQSSQTV